MPRGGDEGRVRGRAELHLRPVRIEGREHLHPAGQPEDRHLEGGNLLGAEPAAVRPQGALQA
eukprot:6214646-Alexandrium_andersonii.AAC.1